GGPHAFTFAQGGFEARAARRPTRIRLQFFQLSDDRELIEQLGDAFAGRGAGFNERRVAAHVVGQYAEAVKLLTRLVEVGARQVDLVDGDDEAHAGGLGVVDRFFSLRHDTVI